MITISIWQYILTLIMGLVIGFSIGIGVMNIIEINKTINEIDKSLGKGSKTINKIIKKLEDK